MESSYLEDFLQLIQVGEFDSDSTSILEVVEDLRPSNLNHLDVEVFRNKLLLLLVANCSGLSRDFGKYLSFEWRQDNRRKLLINL